jgi:hypothetical protein
MHQGWPKFIESMWMATNDNGLALVTYGPSVVNAKVANGRQVKITEETGYPFNGSVSLTMKMDHPVRFPLYLRIPGWADSVIIKYKNQSKAVKGGSEFMMENRWKDGDMISIEIPMKIRVEQRSNRSLSVLRGPLYFSLRIDKEYKSVKINYDNFSYKGSTDWQISPLSPWNYGLIIDRDNVMRNITLAENPIGKYPFADKGDMVWSSDSGKYVMVTEDAPLVITTRGIRIPEWTMKDNSADIPPESPVMPEGDPETISLVPYGCAKLRITEFPVMDITLMEDMMKPGR